MGSRQEDTSVTKTLIKLITLISTIRLRGGRLVETLPSLSLSQYNPMSVLLHTFETEEEKHVHTDTLQSKLILLLTFPVMR